MKQQSGAISCGWVGGWVDEWVGGWCASASACADSTCAGTHTYTHIHIYAILYIHIYIYICMYRYTYVHAHVCMNICSYMIHVLRYVGIYARWTDECICPKQLKASYNSSFRPQQLKTSFVVFSRISTIKWMNAFVLRTRNNAISFFLLQMRLIVQMHLIV